MKNYNFRPIFHNFNENFVNHILHFWRKFGKILEVYAFIRGSEGGGKLAILLKIVQKAMETAYFLKIFINYEKI